MVGNRLDAKRVTCEGSLIEGVTLERIDNEDTAEDAASGLARKSTPDMATES